MNDAAAQHCAVSETGTRDLDVDDRSVGAKVRRLAAGQGFAGRRLRGTWTAASPSRRSMIALADIVRLYT